MKIKAIILTLLALAALLALTGCKNEAMLDNYTSDTFELGEEASVTWDDALGLGDAIGWNGIF